MKPILFNTEMVRAIQANRKTMTRRVVKPPVMNTIVTPPLQPKDKSGMWAFYGEDGLRRAPYHPGDVLYVRETFYKTATGAYSFKADSPYPELFKWRPSIHMPREAARIFLWVMDVRVERLQDITELQILEGEGVQVDFPQPKPSYVSLAYTETKLKPAVRKAFAKLWDSTIKPTDCALYGWDANPWVWVIEFERISREEAQRNEMQ